MALAWIGQGGPVTIALSPRMAPALHGTVWNQSRQPQAGLLVRWTHESQLDNLEVTTDTQGQFAIEDVPPGWYVATLPSGAHFERQVRVKVGVRTKPQTRPLDLVVATKTACTGRVTLPDARPAAGARLWIVRSQIRYLDPDHPAEAMLTRADAEGRFVIRGDPDNLLDAHVRAAWGNLRLPPVRVSEARGRTLALQPEATLQLEVLLRGSGRPLPNAIVDFAPEPTPEGAGRTRWSRPLDHEGRLKQTLLPGRWTLKIRSRSLLAPHEETVDLAATPAPRRLLLRVDGGRSLSGRVTNSAGEGVVARITLHHAKNGSIRQTTESDANGDFVLTGLEDDQPCWLRFTCDGEGRAGVGPIASGSTDLAIHLDASLR